MMVWTWARAWAFRRLNPRLEAKVARNDVGDALGIRAVYVHPDGRRDAMGLSLKEPTAGSDSVILVRLMPDLEDWVSDLKLAHEKRMRAG